MAKTIKFNLILDGNPVRTLEGLRENFSIEDILGYYEKDILARWLKVRGFEKEYDAVVKIDKEETIKNKIRQLIEIFDVEADEAVVEENLEIIAYENLYRELNSIYAQEAYDKAMVIEDYHSGYDKLVNYLIENKDNMSVLKASAQFLEREYYELFKLDNKALYTRLLSDAPKAIFAILMLEPFRKIWLEESEQNMLLATMRKTILLRDRAKEILGDDLKIVKRDTDGVFDEIVCKDKTVMVVAIDPSAYVRNCENFGEKLSLSEVNGKLPLLKGLMYNCTYDTKELLYLEV